MAFRHPNLFALLLGVCARLAFAMKLTSQPELQPPGLQALEQYKDLAEEKRLYEKHWWPLAPPPHHHPERVPTQWEELANDALVQNYTRYWRNLPRYPKVSSLLMRAAQEPYFKVNWRMVEAYTRPKLDDGADPMDAKVFFSCHHKMGVDLHYQLKAALLPALHPAPADVYENLPSWCPPRGTRLLHTVRSPVETIVSGFRYHQNRWGREVFRWGHAHKQDPPCFECDDADHAAMFDACGFNCTYFELLNRVDSITGVTIEALSARRAITGMANSLARCRGANVLHLSFDILWADHRGSVACVLRFLGLEGDQQLQERAIQSMEYVRDPDHVTNISFDNAAIRAHLRGHPSWGPEFAEVDKLMEKTFRRQARLWGCPLPRV